jgi:hypothetical protein
MRDVSVQLWKANSAHQAEGQAGADPDVGQVRQRQRLRRDVSARVHVVQERAAALPHRHLLHIDSRSVTVLVAGRRALN